LTSIRVKAIRSESLIDSSLSMWLFFKRRCICTTIKSFVDFALHSLMTYFWIEKFLWFSLRLFETK
jgi:hypothetical protein